MSGECFTSHRGVVCEMTGGRVMTRSKRPLVWLESQIPEQDSGQLLQRSHRKHPDCKPQRLVHGACRAQDRKAL